MFGAGELRLVLLKLLEDDGQLAFCNLTPTIAKTFEIMGLVQYASVYPDRETARLELAADATP